MAAFNRLASRFIPREGKGYSPDRARQGSARGASEGDRPGVCGCRRGPGDGAEIRFAQPGELWRGTPAGRGEKDKAMSFAAEGVLSADDVGLSKNQALGRWWLRPRKWATRHSDERPTDPFARHWDPYRVEVQPGQDLKPNLTARRRCCWENFGRHYRAIRYHRRQEKPAAGSFCRWRHGAINLWPNVHPEGAQCWAM